MRASVHGTAGFNGRTTTSGMGSATETSGTIDIPRFDATTLFIASMVPHHSGAILMCREAPLKDAELMALCDEISRGQRAEIEQMNAIRARLKAAKDQG